MSAREIARPLSRKASTFSAAWFFRRYALQLGVVAVAVVVWLFFLVSAPRTFLAGDIYISFMSTTPYFALIAIPLTLVIITGEIDLSFASVMSFGMVGYDVVFVATGSAWLGFIACLVFGILAGLINGLIVVKIGVPSLVATIGTWYFWRGVVLVITGGQGLGLTETDHTFLHEMVVGRAFGLIPMQFFWTIIIAGILWFFLNRHRFGAHVYLTGDNIESARLMGINVGRTKILAFTIVGLVAGFAGFVSSAEVLFYWPTLGDAYQLTAIASVFLGGTSVFGGTGTIFGTFVASFVIGAINAGIVAAGLTNFWTQLIYGLIIVGSVAIQTVLSRRLS
ncbi:MAG TPA: ABC transporter permease [Spirochaetia bacterium]|nr:ABC transporter permease [Spirochaetia bacterium]